MKLVFNPFNGNLDYVDGYFVNVKDFGATGDGSTDDTTAINNAISSLGTNSGCIFCPSGTYIISSTISIAPASGQKIEFIGCGRSTIFQLVANASSGTCVITVSGTTARQWSLRNFSVDGNKSNGNLGTTKHGIRINTDVGGDSISLIEDVYVHDTGGNGISMDSGQTMFEIRFTNVIAYSAGQSGFVLYGTDHKLTDCWAQNNFLHGFDIEAANSQLSNCKGAGNGIASTSNYGFYVNGVRVQLTGCQAQDNYRDGIYVNQSQCMVIGCLSESNHNAGLKSGTYAGIRVTSNAPRTTVIGNHCEDKNVTKFQDYGIIVDSGVDNCVIGPNSLNSNLTGGMSIAAAELADNVVIANESTSDTPKYQSYNSDTNFIDSMGLNVTPAARLHQDSGTSTATAHKFTAGTTTGQTSTDGFDVGIDSSGNAEIRQRENLDLTFYTNNTARAIIQQHGRLTVGDTTETAVFFPTDDTKFIVGNTVTSIGTSVSPLDIIKLLSENVMFARPSAATNSSLGITIYAAGGNQLDMGGSNAFNGGLPFGSQQFGNASGIGGFGQVNITSAADVDGAFGTLYSAGHFGAGSDTTRLVGGAFEALTEDSGSPGSPTGTLSEAYGGMFAVGAGGVNITTGASGVFIEPTAYDAGNGYGAAATITNKTACQIRGTLSIKDSDIATAASITNMTVLTSVIRMTGSTATDIHGIHADTFNKLIWIYNVSSATVTLKHQSATDGTAANRIICNTGADVAVTTGKSACLWYDDNQSRWIHLFNS